MQSIKKGSNTAILMVAAMGLTLGLISNAAAQTVQFSSEADAISGTVTKTVAGVVPQTVTISPVDQSTTTGSGSNDNAANSASQYVFGVRVYNIANVNDSTSDSETVSLDEGVADASSGAVSLLNGLVTFASNDDPLTCTPDASDPTSAVDCTSTETTTGLTIAGTPVAAGTYPAGTSFNVQGSISDPECLVGTETFTGILTLQTSTFSGLGTDTASINLTGIELVGDAVCESLDLVPLFNTQYVLAIGGPNLSLTELQKSQIREIRQISWQQIEELVPNR